MAEGDGKDPRDSVFAEGCWESPGLPQTKRQGVEDTVRGSHSLSKTQEMGTRPLRCRGAHWALASRQGVGWAEKGGGTRWNRGGASSWKG